MKKLPYLLILSGLISAPALAADAPASPHTVAFNVGVTTDYIFRGITQTQHDPAISGGVDYSHASGFYAGAWLSNQKWVETGGTSLPVMLTRPTATWNWIFTAATRAPCQILVMTLA